MVKLVAVLLGDPSSVYICPSGTYNNIHSTLPQTAHHNMDAMTRTPQQSPTRQVPSITQAQKQALVDNLQLESKEQPLQQHN